MKRNHKIALAIISIIIVAVLSVGVYFYLESLKLKVGIIDSGISFPGKGVESKSFVTVENDYKWDEEAYDLLGHGSKVFDILKSDISANVKFYSAKITSEIGEITIAGLKNSLKWMEDEGVKIISLSVGGLPRTRELEFLVYDMAIKGIIIVSAIGNTGGEFYNHGLGELPAIYPFTVGVGAINTLFQPATYNSYGRSYLGNFDIDFVEEAHSNDLTLSGTSFSTPRVAAKIVDLYDYARQKDIILNVDQVITLFAKGVSYNPLMGFGVPNLALAMINLDSYLVNKIPFGVIYTDQYNLLDENLLRYRNEQWNATYYYKIFDLETSDFSLYLRYKYNQSGTLEGFQENPIEPVITHRNSYLNNSFLMYFSPNNNLFSIEYEMWFEHETTIISEIYTIKTNYSITPGLTFLFDYTAMEDLRYHEFGRFTEVSKILRANGFITLHTFNRFELNYSSFDVIYTPYLSIRENPEGEIDLIDYMKAGGNWIASYSLNFELSDDLSDLLNLTKVNLGRDSTGWVSTERHLLTADVPLMYYQGLGFLPNNSYNIWSKISEPILFDSEVHLGLNGVYELGTFIIIGSSVTFDDYGVNRAENKNIFQNLYFFLNNNLK